MLHILVLIALDSEMAEFAENLDLTKIVTPIRVAVLHRYLIQSDYCKHKTSELIHGFTHGFDLGYRGPRKRQCKSNNMPLRVGSQVELWNKLIKEVKLGRVAGPFPDIPFKYYIQSPIGLVPKDGGLKTRLIFHLSYDFGSERNSVNYMTPNDICSVKYRDIDHAIRNSLRLIAALNLDTTGVFYSRTDVASAFRVLPLNRRSWSLLVMKARNPATQQMMYFSDKVVPFGGSRSCALFQSFSDCLQHIAEHLCGVRYRITNYLDDFLIIGQTDRICNNLVSRFLQFCREINCPISVEKTEYASQQILFLGILLDGHRQVLAIPEEKRIKAVNTLNWLLSKNSLQVRSLQSLTGLLNFLNRAMVPGRAFTRRMYAKCSNIQLNRKPYHHVKINRELKFDCRMWLFFLDHHRQQALCRPFVDLAITRDVEVIQFYTDAAMTVGYGCFFAGRCIHGRWPVGFIEKHKPSIMYLELYALCVGIFAWQELLTNCRIAIYCDNTGVRDIVNDMSTGCRQSMVLIRMLTLNNLVFNRRLFVDYIKTDANVLADALSRENFPEFWKHAPVGTRKFPDITPAELDPISKLWLSK